MQLRKDNLLTKIEHATFLFVKSTYKNIYLCTLFCFKQKVMNKKLFSTISVLFLSFTFFVLSLSAQTKIEIDGKPFYTYNVKAGESLYSISKLFKVSVEDILVYNPSTKDGIQAGQVLNIPVKRSNRNLKLPQQPEPQPEVVKTVETTQVQNRAFKHTIQRGETLYSISRMYNTSPEAILSINPSAKEGIYVGDTLDIPQKNVTAQQSTEAYYRFHTIQPKETLYSLARAYKVSPEQIVASNPGLSSDTFLIGRTIRIPSSGSNIWVNDNNDVASQERKAQELLNKQTEAKSLNVIRVGLLLPFLDNTSQNDYRLQEYYEGMLLAVKELKGKGANIEMFVFETGKAEETQKLESLLTTSEIKNLNLIIGGFSESEINVLSRFTKDNNIRYVIPFSSKNNDVLHNPNIFQVNSPLSYIFGEASGAFSQSMKDANVLFVNVPGKLDKNEFVTTLQKDLKRKNIFFKTIELDANIMQSIQTSFMAGIRTAIIPTSGDKASLKKLLDAIKKFKAATPDANVSLYGYPEWQTYGNSYQADYHKIGTYIYSSFFVDERSSQARSFEQNFNYWYKRKLLNTYPKYGILGYDTGLYFLTAFHNFGDNFEKNIGKVSVNTIQFVFDFERVNSWGGFINNGLYIINYDVNGSITKREIK